MGKRREKWERVRERDGKSESEREKECEREIGRKWKRKSHFVNPLKCDKRSTCMWQVLVIRCDFLWFLCVPGTQCFIVCLVYVCSIPHLFEAFCLFLYYGNNATTGDKRTTRAGPCSCSCSQHIALSKTLLLRITSSFQQDSLHSSFAWLKLKTNDKHVR